MKLCCCGGRDPEPPAQPPPGKTGELRVDTTAALPEPTQDEDEEETGGLNEPPATPVGRDELALKRHRFFSDLMAVAEAQGEHRVRFDPRGPSFSGGDNEDQRSVSPASPPGARMSMAVAGYREIVAGPLASYLLLSDKIGGHVAEQAALVKQAFTSQLSYIEMASTRGQPSDAEQVSLLGPTSKGIQAVQELREKNRASPFFNHLSAVSESIPALGWVTVKPAPSPYVKEMSDAGMFYTNRVLKEWKEKDKTHVEWVKAWLEALSDMQRYVKQHHTTGLVWSGTGTGSGVPPPPGPPPPPPPCLDPALDLSSVNLDDGRSALFAQINQGADITRGLKKVTSEMQTHKNPSLRSGPAPFKASVHSGGAAPPQKEKSPVFTRDGKKWLIEHHKGNKNLVVEGAEMNNVVYVYACTDSTVQIKGKINSVFVDSCKKTSVLFDTLVSSIEFVNCHSVQMQVLGKVPTVSVDKTNGCQIFLNKESLDVEVVSSTSTELNICVPKPNGDYAEYAVPEQLKTVIKNNGIETTLVENKG